VKGQNNRSVRLRYTAVGALAALVIVGALAGTAALAARPHAQTHGHAAMAKGWARTNGASKTPTPPVPGKTHASQPASDQPFLNDVQRLVDDAPTTAETSAVMWSPCRLLGFSSVRAAGEFLGKGAARGRRLRVGRRLEVERARKQKDRSVVIGYDAPAAAERVGRNGGPRLGEL